MSAKMTSPSPGIDVAQIRSDFPILSTGAGPAPPCVYLDSAATSQKPNAVIDAIGDYYRYDNANVHRGVHRLSQRATDAYEGARDRIRSFLGARQREEIVFTRGTTEAINLVTNTFGRSRVGPGDDVIVSAMEHHSNIVPWQMLCEAAGANLRVIPMDDRGVLDLLAYRELFSEKTRMVALVHVSNALGTINPIVEMIQIAHERGVPVLVDGAQAAPHMSVNVAELDCDFYAVSAHKMYGPTGIGVLYGKRQHLESMPPYQGGGDMIRYVTFERTEYNTLPYRLEAGTPNIAGAIGFGAAVEYLEKLGMNNVAAHEAGLLEYATNRVSELSGIRLIGTAPHKAGVVSFVMDAVHPHDIGTILDAEGVAIRTGHHCAQPVMDRLGVPATARASFGVYNTREDVDALIAGLIRVQEVFGE